MRREFLDANVTCLYPKIEESSIQDVVSSVQRNPLLPRPPDAAADVVDEGRNDEGAHQDRIEEDAEGDDQR